MGDKEIKEEILEVDMKRISRKEIMDCQLNSKTCDDNSIRVADAQLASCQEQIKAKREEIAKTMYYQHVTSGFKWENEDQWFRDKYLSWADQIIALIGGE